MAMTATYVNGRKSGCPTYRTLKLGGVLNAIPYLGRMDSRG